MSQPRTTRCAREYNSAVINAEVSPGQCVWNEWATLRVNCRLLPASGFVVGPTTADAPDPNFPSLDTRLARAQPESKSALCLPSWLLSQFDVFNVFVLLKIEFKKYLKHIKYFNKNTAWYFNQCLLCNYHQRELCFQSCLALALAWLLLLSLYMCLACLWFFNKK